MDGLSSPIKESIGKYTSDKDLWFNLEEECQRRSQDIEKETKVKDEKQEENHVHASDTSEGKHSSINENSECHDDESILTEDEQEILLKANNAFTSTLLDIDLKFNPRLKKKILRSLKNKKRRQNLCS